MERKISYFNFPKWLVAIRRDPGDDFVLRENTTVCSRHFKQTDLKKSLNGVVNPKKGSVPCKFPWSPNSPRKRKAPKERSSLPTKGARVDLEIEQRLEHETEELKSDEDYLREELHALKAENDAMKERMAGLEAELGETTKETTRIKQKFFVKFTMKKIH